MDSQTGDAAADGLLSASPGQAPGVDAVRSSIAPQRPAASSNDVPAKVQVYREHRKRTPMVRPGFGTEGRRIQLLANHFSVKLSSPNVVFYHYSVSITSQDNNPVNGRGFRRKVMDKLYQTYNAELEEKCFAYDGEKSLFTVGPLPQNNFEFVVIIEESSWRGTCSSPSENDHKRSRRSHPTKKFNVEIDYAAKIPLKSISLALSGNESENAQDALRVLDIVLRQQHAKKGHLLVRQSFFRGDLMDYADLGGGITGCRGFHSSFRTTLNGLSLNMDVSTTTILTPGPVVNFLLANQNVRGPCNIDWTKAKRMLKNMRIKTMHNNMEFKIIGISELPCNQQYFKMKTKDNSGEALTVDISVYDYFLKNHSIQLTWSASLPCLDVGRPKRSNYLPIELCHLVPLQRYVKALSSQQRAALVEKSRQKPQERIKVVIEAVKNSHYDEDPVLNSCGVFIEKQLTLLDGRVLTAPTLKVGNSEDCIPRNGRWNFNNKRLCDPIRIHRWAIVNFSARCDLHHLSKELVNCGRKKGIHIEHALAGIEEDRQWIKCGPVVRVERMVDKIKEKLREPPEFLLCVLPEKKNSELYGPWKKKTLHELGIVTQCVAPTKINDQYLTNLLLKINSKLGGTNSLLATEVERNITSISEIPTMILGMDVSHGSPGRSDVPSIAAVVGSRCWPFISRYSAAVRTQSPKAELIDSLYKPLENGKDDGMLRELLLDFYNTSKSRKPSHVIIFRDGVSESQFNQVLNIELNQIIKVFEHLGESTPPKFTIIVAQKNHHTKLFQASAPINVPPGTVVDTKVVHPRNYDFYMCAHAGMIGTSRPTHYNVLLDEIGFSANKLQELVHSLSYVYQRSTTAISVVAPIYYAHLAAKQMSQFIKFDAFSETSPGPGSVSSAGPPSIPEIPRLHQNVSSSMFFC